MKKLFLALVSGALVSGCATKDYALYAEAQKSAAQARAMADTARYAALAEIAKSGDSAAKVAAVISLNMAAPAQQNNTNITPPKTLGETALQWTSLLLPSLTQIYGIHKNTEVSVQQSNNAALVARSTNEAFVGIASKIQAPQASVTTTTVTNNTTTNTSSIGRDNNTGANSGNTGKVAGGDQNDSTSTPTVVKPEVVNTTTTNTTNNNSNNTTTGNGP